MSKRSAPCGTTTGYVRLQCNPDKPNELAMSIWGCFIDRVRLARSVQKGVNFARLTYKRLTDSRILDLVQAIVERSLKCTELLDDKFRNSFPESNTDYLQKRIEVFFECVCFFTHIASRVVLNKFGSMKRRRINDLLAPMLVEFTLERFYKPRSSDSPCEVANGFKQMFHNRLNASEDEYSLCKTFVLKLEDDTTYVDKVAGGLKSKGSVNLFTDNVANTLDQHSPITYLHIMQTLISASDAKGIEAIAIKAARRI